MDARLPDTIAGLMPCSVSAGGLRTVPLGCETLKAKPVTLPLGSVASVVVSCQPLGKRLFDRATTPVLLGIDRESQFMTGLPGRSCFRKSLTQKNSSLAA